MRKKEKKGLFIGKKSIMRKRRSKRREKNRKKERVK